MCGIAGVLTHNRAPFDPAQISQEMASALTHRGPDDCGAWGDPVAGIGLAHQRLSIIDTSSEARQPMRSPAGHLTVTYNGEIYNFLELRTELQREGVRFRTQSDTEVLVAAFECWGTAAALKRLVGMFALAVWDARDRSLTLARDRAGEKPLYWGLVDHNLYFASELKSFRRIPGFKGIIDCEALQLYCQYAYVPAPRSIYESIHKLPPGHWLQARRTEDGMLRTELSRYWQLEVSTEAPRCSYAEAQEHAEALLKQAVRGQMVADVPLGAFLSGGIDSSAIVALMQEQSTAKIRTFSLGSTESAYDESHFAADVARHLGTEHVELRVSPVEAMEIVPQLGSIYDEPFADSSQIPTTLVSRLARRSVTVALSGDAGDEVFGGYNRYVFAPRVWNAIGRWPPYIRGLAADGLALLSPAQWNRLVAGTARLTGKREFGLPGEKLHKLARAIHARDRRGLYERLTSCWVDSPLAGPASHQSSSWYQIPEVLETDPGRYVDLMMYLDFVTYLPDDILVKVDRASMSASLESRVPCLDHRLIEYMSTLPAAYKMKPGASKRILRDIAYSRVPASLLDRPKMGFGVPIDVWLRGPLRDWAQDLLSSSSLNAHGLFNNEKIASAWREHQRGDRLRHHELWAILMFQSWYRSAAGHA